jgi:hypothetical protein
MEEYNKIYFKNNGMRVNSWIMWIIIARDKEGKVEYFWVWYCGLIWC